MIAKLIAKTIAKTYSEAENHFGPSLIILTHLRILIGPLKQIPGSQSLLIRQIRDPQLVKPYSSFSSTLTG
jgi:hypothetical protein